MTATFDEAGLLARRLPLAGTFNVRDVGGYGTAGGQTVKWRTLWRGDALGEVDDAGRELLAGLGLRTALDLRDAHERDAAPDRVPDGVDLVSVALLSAASPADLLAGGTGDGGPDDRPERNGPEYDNLLDVYRMLVDERGHQLAEAVKALARPGALPAIVHCTAGKDRTGVLTALVLSALGVPDDVIAADFAATALFLTDEFKARLSSHVSAGGVDPSRVEEMLRSDPDVILQVLDRVRDGHGSAAAYLSDHGVDAGELAALRAALLEDRSGGGPDPSDASPASGLGTGPGGAGHSGRDHRVIIQISDVHVVSAGLLHGVVDPLAVLTRMLEAIERTAAPDLLIFTGDLADKGEGRAYERLRAVVQPAAARMGVPVLYVPGNHDSRAPFRHHLLGWDATDEVIDQVRWCGGMRVVALDSTVPGEPHGDLEDAQLAWLAAQLEVAAPLGTVLALHHPPIPGPSELLNRMMLRAPERLAVTVAGTDVVMILAGHTHHASAGVLAGVPVWVATAGAYQMDVMSLGWAMRGLEGSGFTRIDVTPAGAVATYLPLIDADRAVYEVDLATMERFLDHDASVEEVEAAFHGHRAER